MRGWPWYVGVVVGNALLQGALVLGDPLIELAPGFVLRVLASALSLVVGVSLVACTAVWGGPRSVRQVARVAAWATGIGLLAAAGAVLAPWLGPVLLLLGAFVLPSVAADAGPLAGFSSVPRRPVRHLLALLAYALLVVIGWLAALLLGFFVTGAPAAVATWLWLGVSAVVVLRIFSRLRDSERLQGVRDSHGIRTGIV